MWNINKPMAHVEEAIKQVLPPCQIKCPIGEDIQRTNVLISLLPDDLESAKPGILQIGDYLYEKNPLFNICGYICGLCELECHYKNNGGSIRRRLLKRFISDHYTETLDQKEELDIEKDKDSIAIIGGGPAGLMCAYTLSKRGYKVTIFESSGRLGGALWLIPDYRLPKDVLSTTIKNLVRIAGIEVKYNSQVGGGNLSLEKIKKNGFKAVFIAKGTPEPRPLTFGSKLVDGQQLSGVMYGQDYLYEVSHNNIDNDYFAGQKVLIIGGGNVAFDAARTAVRQGGEVTLMCLENKDKSTRDGIPADEEEIRGAWEEGVKIVYSRGVNKIIGENGRFKGITCPSCTQVYDTTGFNPKFDMSDTLEIKGDILIITVGQITDRKLYEKSGLLNERGGLAVDGQTLQSKNVEWVFIGGDTRKVGFMADAMQEGVVAAESIERYLLGLDVNTGRTRQFESYDIPLRDRYKKEVEVVWIPPEKRMHFELFEKSLSLTEVIEEAKRCLTCGPCISCKACVYTGIQDELHELVVNEKKCSGCGLCVYACNYGAAYTVRKDGVIVSRTESLRCKSCGICVAVCPSGARTMVNGEKASRMSQVYAALSQTGQVVKEA